MNSKSFVWIACLVVLLMAGMIVAVKYPSTGREKESPTVTKTLAVSDNVKSEATEVKEQLTAQKAPSAADNAKPEPAEVAAVRETSRAYAQAFAKGDAKAIADLWTENGEYDGFDTEPLRGRAAIETAYARFFKDNPQATLEGKLESVRLLGSRAAVEEGTLRSRLQGNKESGETRFSAFLVLEDGGWRFASVREWMQDQTEKVSLDDIAWLAGEWLGKGKEGEARLSFTLDENKVFLRGQYTVSRGGKVVSSGTQVIGKDPNGGLRSWQFEGDGGFGEWVWSRDGNHWVIQANGTLPDGDTETATNLLLPINKDAFTWHVLERTTGGVVQSGQPPVKVTRVKGR